MYRMMVIGATLRNGGCRGDKIKLLPYGCRVGVISLASGRRFTANSIAGCLSLSYHSRPVEGKPGEGEGSVPGSGRSRSEAAREVVDELPRRPAAAGAGGERPPQGLLPQLRRFHGEAHPPRIPFHDGQVRLLVEPVEPELQAEPVGQGELLRDRLLRVDLVLRAERDAPFGHQVPPVRGGIDQHVLRALLHAAVQQGFEPTEVGLPLVERQVVAEEEEPVRQITELPDDLREREQVPAGELHDPQAPRPEDGEQPLHARRLPRAALPPQENVVRPPPRNELLRVPEQLLLRPVDADERREFHPVRVRDRHDPASPLAAALPPERLVDPEDRRVGRRRLPLPEELLGPHQDPFEAPKHLLPGRRRDHGIRFPPDTGRYVPVMRRASSEARKRTAPATSSGRPFRRSGVISAEASFSFCERNDVASVRVSPGATTFTRIPFGPSSSARDFAKASSPDFAVLCAQNPSPG